ncbi:MAG: tRNA (adenosine(37)-N6)-threonylcarbamoyltransferase complex dimerization subunit type 1 TsaB [Anaerolineae bacterium]|nr:tRNA (adenosine(37)-N6)-threonylcarbamoyltransferase complex dimerization subunit type 1 TsaB [Anaerolineae bacterium]
MLLAIDSATRKIGIALYDGAEVLHEAVWHSANFHTVELAPAIHNALERAGIHISDVEVIALAIGPGSYTGLRIGSAVAKGIALAQHKPLVGVSTFDILAAAQPAGQERLAVVLEAGRKRLGIGWYRPGENGWEFDSSDLFTPDEFSKSINKPTLVCGEISAELRQLLGRKRKNVVVASPAACLRRPAFLAEIAWQRWQEGDSDDPATLAPQYLQTGENIPA